MSIRAWHRIESVPTPGMTTRETLQAQPGSMGDTERLNRFQKIARTSRGETATRSRSSEKREGRGERKLIDANKKANNPDHERARIEARFARRNHSSSNARYVAPVAAARAIVTIQTFRESTVWFLRTISRKRRRTRFRCVAFPTLRDVIKPARKPGVASSLATPIVTKLPRCI
jgi:hypothetical protein